MRFKVIIAAFALTLIAAGCRQPVNDYAYKNLNRIKGWTDGTPVVLDFEMTDTTGACELYLAGEIKRQRSATKSEGFPINLTFTAPDGSRYADSVTLPVNVVKGKGISSTSHGVMNVEWPYRKNIYNKIPGNWSVMITKGDPERDYSNIIGLGIHCRQRKL